MINPEIHDAYEIAPCGYKIEHDRKGFLVIDYERITTPELVNWEDQGFDGVVWTVYVHLKAGGVEVVCDCATQDIAVQVTEGLQIAYPLKLGITYIE